MPAVPVIARAGLHLWEEPVLSGTRGSGAVFFSGCSLGCVYCQNHTISAEGVGKAVTTERLREIFRELIAQGAHNIDLITASHFVPFLLPALEEPLPVPVVFNCGGYERVETLRLLEGKVQIWLPDLKYGLEEPARRYSHAPDYFPVATEAIREMFRQVGPCRMEDGLLRQGVVIRHLVLPGELENTKAVIDWVSGTFRPGDVLFSLMSDESYYKLMRYEHYGMIILLVLIASDVLGAPLQMVTQAVFKFLFAFAEWGFSLSRILFY